MAISLIIFGTVQASHAAITASSLKAMKIDKIDSFQGMRRAVEALAAGVERVTGEQKDLFDLQKQIVAVSGVCISRVVALQQGAGKKRPLAKKQAKTLLNDLRNILNTILNHNVTLIANLQEHQLDKMEDPQSFFNSPAWQAPNTIVSLASYWIGWNGYYLSTLLQDKTPEKNQVLEEAVTAFSRSFIDFKEDTVVTKSLFGRALCYQLQGAYERAAHDLKQVKRKIGKADPLFYRCVYEEAVINYRMGNLGPALRILDDIQDEVPADKISPQLMNGFNRLRAKILLASLDKKTTGQEKNPKDLDDAFFSNFNRIKTLAESNPHLVGEFYQFVQTNAERLKSLSFDQLGPIGMMAMGDYFFAHHRMNKALKHYLHLNATTRKVPKEYHDDILFRIGAIYCQKKRWHQALPFLELFAKKFPKSKVTGKAAHLYYVAAVNLYKIHENSETRQKMIAATQSFLKRCPDCPDQSEAHFQLAKYYQGLGKTEKALRHFHLVKNDSPNYRLSRFHLIESKLASLASLAKKEMGDTKTAQAAYREGIAFLDQYMASDYPKRGTPDPLAAEIRILSAQLHLYGPSNQYQKGVAALDGFERRFQKETKLVRTATALKLKYYHRQNRLMDARDELAKFLTETVVDSEYVFVQEMGNDFYNKAIALKKESERTLRGHFLLMALSVYQRLLDICRGQEEYEKDVGVVQLRIGDIYMASGRSNEARGLYQAILRENPKSANAVYNLGMIYEQAGEWKEALANWRHFSDGTQVGTHHWYEARYRTAKAFVALGKKDKACTIIKMTLVLHPDLGDEGLTQKFHDMKASTCPGGTP